MNGYQPELPNDKSGNGFTELQLSGILIGPISLQGIGHFRFNIWLDICMDSSIFEYCAFLSINLLTR
jgi:hypothetical protein